MRKSRQHDSLVERYGENAQVIARSIIKQKRIKGKVVHSFPECLNVKHKIQQIVWKTFDVKTPTMYGITDKEQIRIKARHEKTRQNNIKALQLEAALLQ